MNSQLIGLEVASGHAFEKHVLNGEFATLGVKQENNFKNLSRKLYQIQQLIVATQRMERFFILITKLEQLLFGDLAPLK